LISLADCFRHLYVFDPWGAVQRRENGGGEFIPGVRFSRTNI
jgi:hypothetical protein